MKPLAASCAAFECDEGIVRVADCMPPGDGTESLVRVVEGVRGSVPMRTE